MKIVLLFLATYILAFANSIDNGKAFFYSFEKKDNILVKMDNKNLNIYEHPKNKNKVFIIIPISYKTTDKQKNIAIYSNYNLVENFVLKITKGKYEKETLKVSKKHVKPEKKVQKRIQKEYANAMKIYNTTNKNNHIKSKFILPINSKITSKYGNARVFNNQLKSYHSGTDFRAKVGTKIKAINDGVVVLAKHRYYAGGSVIIDHGRGIYSCYYHLSSFNLKVGQKIKKGEIIALSGASGRITGPHLHLTIKVSGVTVAPLDFINKYNNLF